MSLERTCQIEVGTRRGRHKERYVYALKAEGLVNVPTCTMISEQSACVTTCSMHGAGAGAHVCSLLIQEEVRLEENLLLFASGLIWFDRTALMTVCAVAHSVMRAHVHRVSGASPKIDDHQLSS